VSGGAGNVASGYASTVAGGADNFATGDKSFVAGGEFNQAVGTGSFAAGVHAYADNHSFVFGDGSLQGFASENERQFAALATGGVLFATSVSGQSSYNGARLHPGSGGWSFSSDRNFKKNLEAVDGEALLSAVARIPIWRWSYLEQDASIRHLGPTAQDFRSAFSLGESSTDISSVDADGVNLAAVKALEKRTAKLSEENAGLKTEIERLRATQTQILQKLEELMRERR
jgi:hypothetical protein